MKKILTVVTGLIVSSWFVPVYALELVSTSNNQVIKLSFEGSPVRKGANHARVTVADTKGNPVPNATVKLYYGMMPMNGMPPMNFQTRLVSDGNGYVAPVNFKMKGHWDIKVKVKSGEGKVNRVEMGVMVK